MSVSKQVVAFRGWTFRGAFTVFCIALSIAAIVSFGLSFGFPHNSWTVGICLLASGPLIGVLAVQSQIARTIELDASGIQIRALGQSRRLRWVDFDGFHFPPKFGEIGLAPRSGARTGWAGAYFLSLEQARAILAYPLCPRVEQSESVRIGLGV